MKKLTYSLLAVVVVGLIALCFFRKPVAGTRPQPNTTDTVQSRSGIDRATNSTAMELAQHADDDAQSKASSADIIEKYHQGQITKDEALAEMQKRDFTQPQSLYGKVVDQNGDPVSGVEVTAGNEGLNAAGNGVEPQTYKTESDSNGFFEFTGKTGTPIGIKMRKDGYRWGERGEGYKGPAGGISNPLDRVVVTMWKLHGAEVLRGSAIDAKIPHDGEVRAFDIVTGESTSNGDLLASLIRSPLEVRRGRDTFDWTFRIEIRQGGLVEENDPYPFWAPQDGYRPFFEFSMSSNNVAWTSTMTKDFYIRTPQGQYGRMRASVYTALTPARAQFGFTVNPSGTQNLEPPDGQ
jgi:hypothetical protein